MIGNEAATTRFRPPERARPDQPYHFAPVPPPPHAVLRTVRRAYPQTAGAYDTCTEAECAHALDSEPN